MNTRRAPSWRLRTLVLLAASACGAPALAATCTLKADVNPQSLTIPDFVQTPGGWTPNAVKLNGAASKPEVKDGGLYQWTVKSGPAGYQLANATSPQASFTPPDVGPSGAQYVITLTVTGCGSAASLDYPVSVANAHDLASNAAPHAVAGATPNPADEGATVTLRGSDSWDPDGTPLTYAWNQIAGPAAALDDAGAANPHFVAPDVSTTTTLTFRLTVSDGTLSDTTTVDVNVAWLNEAPVARVSCPLDVDEGQPVQLDGSASSDADDGIASFRWTQGQGGPVVATLPADTAVVSFPAPALGFQQTGMVPFTLTVTDHSGVASSAGCAIFVHDITPPAISVADVLADAEAASGAHVAFVPAPSAFDLVDGDVSATLACQPPSGSLFPLGDTPVVCTAHDSANNVSGAGFTVTVADLSPPVIAAHGDVAAEATGPQGAAVAYDLPATSDKVDGAGTATCTPPPGLFPLGTTGVDCDAVDQAGNAAATTHFSVSVLDTTPPALTLPGPVVAEATGPGGAAVAFLASASDLVDGGVAVSCDHPSGTTFPLGTTAVACSASDTHGNTAHGGFSVTVRDTTAPVLQAHADVTVLATSAAGAVVGYLLPGATDQVDPAVEIACVPPPGSSFPLGQSVVQCTARDFTGNTASASFKVNVQYPWTGFFRPIDNLPVANGVKAGSAVPVKFSLGGNMGLAIFAAGSPRTSVTGCSAGSADPVEETVTAGNSSLTYDATAGQYVYVWKTDKAWAGSCRKLQLTLADGTVHEALFTFSR